MGQAIGQVLSFGVGVSISPIPIIAVVLMLSTERGRANGPAFLVGWVVGLAVVGTVVLLVSSGAGASDNGGSGSGNSDLKLVLGVILLLVALRQWRGRPQGDAVPELPGWMKTVDAFSPAKAAGAGVVLSAVNPKNLILTVGAAAAIGQVASSTGDQIVALIVFVIVATVGPAIPVVIYFFMRDRATAILAGMRDWMGRHNAAIMAVLCLVIGAKLIGDAVSGLS